MEIREYPGRQTALTDETFAQLLALYEGVGWTNYTQNPAMLRAACQNSLLALAAWEGEKLIGLLRAVGDGASIVFVQDLLVLPSCQRQGVGTQLMRALLARYPQVYQLELAADNTEALAAFYRSLGFVPLEEAGCRGYLRMAGLAVG